jgi:hypothetical protein
MHLVHTEGVSLLYEPSSGCIDGIFFSGSDLLPRLLPRKGRVAQRESACFTRRMSLVRSQPCPPSPRLCHAEFG